MFCLHHFYFGLSLVFEKNTMDQEPVGKMNRKQVVLVGPPFYTSPQSQGPLVCSGQCC